MKTQINNTNKQKFFALYWGQHIGGVSESSSSSNYFYNQEIEGDLIADVLSEDFLSLKSISDISNEDIRYIGHLIYGDYELDHEKQLELGKVIMYYHFGGIRELNLKLICPIEKSEAVNCDSDVWMSTQDYLRSKGYALPWMGITVEEQIKNGWIKLIK